MVDPFSEGQFDSTTPLCESDHRGANATSSKNREIASCLTLQTTAKILDIVVFHKELNAWHCHCVLLCVLPIVRMLRVVFLFLPIAYEVAMVGPGSKAKAFRTAILSVYAMFSLFGSSIHAWSHQLSGDACHECNTIPSHSHGHSCQHPAPRSSCESRKHRSFSPSVSHVADHRDHRPAQKTSNHCSLANESKETSAKAAPHSCRVCHQIASLMNSWSASICAMAFDLQQTDYLIDSYGNDSAVEILIARSRGPPSRI